MYGKNAENARPDKCDPSLQKNSNEVEQTRTNLKKADSANFQLCHPHKCKRANSPFLPYFERLFSTASSLKPAVKSTLRVEASVSGVCVHGFFSDIFGCFPCTALVKLQLMLRPRCVSGWGCVLGWRQMEVQRVKS